MAFFRAGVVADRMGSHASENIHPNALEVHVVEVAGVSPYPRGAPTSAAPPSVTLASSSSPVARRGSDWTHLLDELHSTNKEVVEEAFPEQGLKRFRQLRWFGYHGLIRARGGISCPLDRITVWFAGLRELGYSQAQAELIRDRLDEVIDRIWSAESIDLTEAMMAEKAAECAGEMAEARVLAHGQGRHEAAMAMRRERAREAVAIKALECGGDR